MKNNIDPAPGFIPTNEGHRIPEDIVSDLTYFNYVFNRDRNPEISVDRWAHIYGEYVTKIMERRYQNERNIDKNAAKDSLETRTYNITGPKDQLESFEKLLSSVDYVCRVGSTVQFKLSIDGDGAASISIKRKDGKKLSTLDEKDILDNTDFSIVY